MQGQIYLHMQTKPESKLDSHVLYALKYNVLFKSLVLYLRCNLTYVALC
jgi:hypothetical protein